MTTIVPTGEMVIGTRHIYGSDSFRTLLETQGFRRPEITLVVAFCPANKQYAFDLIPMRVDRQADSPPFDVLQRDRPEIPYINAHVHGIAAAHPVLMHMTEQL